MFFESLAVFEWAQHSRPRDCSTNRCKKGLLFWTKKIHVGWRQNQKIDTFYSCDNFLCFFSRSSCFFVKQKETIMILTPQGGGRGRGPIWDQESSGFYGASPINPLNWTKQFRLWCTKKSSFMVFLDKNGSCFFLFDPKDCRLRERIHFFDSLSVLKRF